MLSLEVIASHLAYLFFVLSKINLFYTPLSGTINIHTPPSFVCIYSLKLTHTVPAQNQQNTMHCQHDID